ncbi:S8 family serine peptidase [Bacillus sp. 31A1R]|uniref:S8 family serine peptidase n=1 Tax=Robertmurraya mangrovi TaxID=3098077 RepID=A0ABU5IXH3_9BACI|nr:S8 family serine peptidase [Bacillus sp. 31A1R]MDZ5471868.1 S8 family serine peptidase [Bacillus sp. 31A1R]
MMKRFTSVFLSLALLFTFLPTVLGSSSSSSVGYYSVLFKQSIIPADFGKQVNQLGGDVVYTVPEIGYAQVKISTSSFTKLKGLANVSTANPSIKWNLPKSERISESNVNTADAALWEMQWDIKRITNNGESYKLGTGSHNVVVGIVDTGIDRDHPDLVGNLLDGSKNFVPAGGFQGTEPNETGDINAFDDRHGHGSHVAGSIAGNGAMLGVAPNTGIRAYRVFGTGSAESGWIYNAMIAAANDGVDIISMSLGGFDILGQVFYVDPETGKKEALGNDVADFKAYKRAVDYVTKKGSLVVVAAGNDGLNATNKKEVTNYLNAEYGGNGLYYVGAGFEVPGTIPGVVTVSATGQEDVLADYSNYGPGFIDIATVGGDTKLYNQYAAEGRFNEYLAKRLFEKEFNLSAGEDGGYYWSIGTSMATPKVSAVAALLIDKYGKMSPSKLQDLLYKTAVDPVTGKERSYFGAGHLNAYNALR